MTKNTDNDYFDALCKEAQFTVEMLCSGYTEIRKANYAKRGVYFQAFISLSTGFERIGKLCYLLIYAIEHGGSFPTDKDLKKVLRHDIIKLYELILEFKNNHDIKYDFLQDLDKPIYQSILNVLSRFAKGDRYANIDLLINNRSYDDPISVWYKDVDLVIFQEKISDKKKEKIKRDASLVHYLTFNFVMLRHTGEDGKEINTAFEGSLRTGINDAVAPYRQLYVFHIIRFFVESLNMVESVFNNKNFFEIPYFMEIFRVFYNDDSYMKGRKTINLL